MSFFLRNFHIIVFAFISMFAAGWVSSNPERTVRLMEPVVEDAAELGAMASVVYKSVESTDWRTSANEVVAMYVVALRMPSMLFERLETRLADLNEQLNRLGYTNTTPTGQKLSGSQKLSILRDLQSGRKLQFN